MYRKRKMITRDLGISKSKSTSFTTASWWSTRKSKDKSDTYKVSPTKSDIDKMSLEPIEKSTDVERTPNSLIVYNVRNSSALQIFANNYFYINFNLFYSVLL